MTAESAAALIDTSVVVRYLTDDPPELAALAAKVIDSEAPLLLSEVALAECAYVLTSVYEVPRDEAVSALMAFIQRRNVRLVSLTKPLALEALQLCLGSGRHSFADALLWAQARQSGSRKVITFDRRFPDAGLELELLRADL